jgi:hypothetical protein
VLNKTPGTQAPLLHDGLQQAPAAFWVVVMMNPLYVLKLSRVFHIRGRVQRWFFRFFLVPWFSFQKKSSECQLVGCRLHISAASSRLKRKDVELPKTTT